MPTTYEPIATANGDGSATTITFSSIPGTYTDLQLVINATSPASGQNISPAVRFNSSAGTAYSETVLWGDGTSTGSYRLTSRGLFSAGPTQVGVQNVNPCIGIVDILSYAGSTFKPSLVTASVDNNGSGSTERITSIWNSTSAITSVSILSQGAAFSTSSVFTLYGIKAA